MTQDQPTQEQIFYSQYDKNMYRITGNEQSDEILAMLSVDQNSNNAQMVAVSGSDIMSGVSTDTQQVATGSMQGGSKRTFDNVNQGYILGLDAKDGYAKFYIGNSTSYLNWDGSSLNVAGSISASTITGGTFQTATSGQRIRITSTSAISPSQSANSLILVNSSGNDILDFGSNASIIMRILPTDDDNSGLLIQNNVISTKTMLEVDTLNSSSTGAAVSISQAGTGYAIFILGTNNSIANPIAIISGSTYRRNILDLESNYAGALSNTIFNINKSGSGAGDCINIVNAGTGYGIYVNQSNVSNSVNALFITNAGSGSTVDIVSSSASNNNNTVYIDNTATTNAAPLLTFGGLAVGHFRKNILLGGGGQTIWCSDGSNPNGTLSGTAGDLCLGGPTGHPFYCTGTTYWTQI